MIYKMELIEEEYDENFIESCINTPDKIEIGTCWIGDKKTYDEIINNL
jgi:hypothetical protein